MELWLTERESDSVAMRFRVREVLHTEESAHQRIAILELEALGRTLVLGDEIQVTERDSFIYHEMLAHVPLTAHPRPERVLIVGGGDLGLAAEVLKHPEVRQVDLVEIDARVLEVSRRWLAGAEQTASDPRVRLVVDDGARFVASVHSLYDVVLVDAPDPLGPAVPLFGAEFYRSVREALRNGGMVAAQSGGAWFQQEVTARLLAHAAAAFPRVAVYTASVPSYSIGPWTFLVGSLGPDPARPDELRARRLDTRYYTPELHRAAFALAPFIRQALEQRSGVRLSG